ncbi:hypothetical protein EXU57_11020 [Segetibacter sp. 3557_3]|uniref:hypothetical protein n=1 Tax=Segetibacter sp. 3557_3 TaxID=2547429 RepID=UPI0010591B73|nr:hypothetical protein [Segetibacter sp. 3557_3]TDH26612.1 hypothetical protein EXU57_11020 [Segetibacter sp. 3557_3]
MNTLYKRTKPVHTISGYHPRGGFIATPKPEQQSGITGKTKDGGYIAWPESKKPKVRSFNCIKTVLKALKRA